MDKMKAGVLVAPAKISCQAVSLPSAKSGEALVRVAFSGVCSSDIKRVMEQGGAYHYPLIPGHEFSGVIEKINGAASGLKPGDAVAVFPLLKCDKCEWCKKGRDSLCGDYDYLGSRRDGGFAQFVAAPLGNLKKLPKGVTLSDGSLVEPAAVALHGAKKAGILKGDVVAVYGAGTVGLFAMQWAKYFGAASVIAIDRNAHKLAFAKKIGADETINAQEQDIAAEVARITGGRGADVVLECAGAASAQAQSIEIVRKAGSIVFIGNSRGDLVIGERLVPKILRKEISINGSWNADFVPDWEETVEGIASGKVKAEELITHRFKIDKVAEVFVGLKGRKYGNLVKATFEF